MEVRRLSFSPRRDQAPTVADASFQLHFGFTALIGPNGAGKTTLMRLLAGLYRPTRGQITSRGARPNIAYVPQFPGAYLRLSTRRFLLRMALWEGLSVFDAEARVAAALSEMRLESVAEVRGRHLDDSARRRLALASVFVRNAKIVLMDEPTANLDPNQRLAFWQDLYRLRNNPESPETYLIATHHLDEVDSYCHRVVLLDRGRVRFDGTVAQLKERAQDHTFWSPAPLSERRDGPLLELSWKDGNRYAIVSERHAPRPDWTPRRPSLWDGYLIALKGRSW